MTIEIKKEWNDCPICGHPLEKRYGYGGLVCFWPFTSSKIDNYHYWAQGPQEVFLIEPYFVINNKNGTEISYNIGCQIIYKNKKIIPSNQLSKEKIDKWVMLL